MHGIPDPTIVIIPAPRPDIVGSVPPRPGAHLVKDAVAGVAPGLSIGYGTLIVLVPAIRHPLGYISAHVVKAERIRLDLVDFRRLPRILVAIASLAVDHPRLNVVAPPVFGARAAARRIFPFGLGRQPKNRFRCLVQPRNELLGIVEADIG